MTDVTWGSRNGRPHAQRWRPVWARGAVLVATLLALVAAVPAASARAQSEAWSPPLHLSPPGPAASFPNVIADNAGGAHVTWASNDDRYDLVMYTHLTPGANAWDAPMDVVANPHNPGEFYVSRPMLTIDDNWQMSLGVHAPGDNLYVATAPAPRARDPFAWANNLFAASGYHIIPLAAGPLLHLVYTQGVQGAGCQQCLHLFYTNSSDSGVNWSNAVDVGRRADRGNAKPHLLFGHDGALHLVWETGLDGDRGYVIGSVRTMYAASYDKGATWSLPVELDTLAADEARDEVAARNVALAQAGDGTLVAVWWQMPEDLIYYRTSRDNGRTWEAARSVPSVWGVGTRSRTRQDTYAMATDSDGNVHLLMVGRLGSDDAAVALLHLAYTGSGWSYPFRVATYENDLPEWPSASIGLGNQLHVVWHVRTNALRVNPDDTAWEVWESHILLPSPALPAFAMPAPVPTLSAADAATPLPPTPVPPTLMPAAERTEPEQPVTIQTLMTENDDVALLALALVPAALLVAVGLLWQHRRSRNRQ